MRVLPVRRGHWNIRAMTRARRESAANPLDRLVHRNESIHTPGVSATFLTCSGTRPQLILDAWPARHTASGTTESRFVRSGSAVTALARSHWAADLGLDMRATFASTVDAPHPVSAGDQPRPSALVISVSIRAFLTAFPPPSLLKYTKTSRPMACHSPIRPDHHRSSSSLYEPAYK